MAAEAMQRAKQGREQQLKLLEQYHSGEPVVFMNHQGKEFPMTYDPSAEKPKGSTKIQMPPEFVFWDAVINGEADTVEAMLKDKVVSANVANQDKLTALHMCAIDNVIKIVPILCQYGADVNAQDQDLWTPLHAAAACGNWRIVQHLLTNGADVRAVNIDGELPIDLCEDERVENMIQEEMDRQGVDESQIESLRDKPQQDFTKVIKALINIKHDLDAKDDNGVTPLHVAACNGWVQAAQLLLDSGASPNSRDSEDYTPLHYAVMAGEYLMVDVLGKNGADPTLVNKFKEPPINLTEDPQFIRLLKALQDKTKPDTLDVPMRAPRERLMSTIKRKSISMRDRSLSLAKRDAAREHKSMEIAQLNYAELDFGKNDKPDYQDPLPPANPDKVVYSDLAFDGNAGKDEPIDKQSADYAIPVPKSKRQSSGSTASVAKGKPQLSAFTSAQDQASQAKQADSLKSNQSDSSSSALLPESRDGSLAQGGKQPAIAEEGDASRRTSKSKVSKDNGSGGGGCCVIL